MSEYAGVGAVPVGLGTPVAAEDQARADLYALLARLYAAPPNDAFLRAIAESPPMGMSTLTEPAESAAAEFGARWDRLRAACGVMDPEAAEQEYQDLFVGVGRSEVNLHASHWLTGFMMEKPLVEVRATLATLGLGRKPDAIMVEDHIAALFETMRLLVAGHGERPPAPIAVQQMFFERHVQPWIGRCCDAIRDATLANFYRHVAEFTESYVALERDSFAMG
ncbi:MAG: molecular chaperone TorD family protein [Casimicrobiaceae bacterium]